jgi:DNA-binding transcriptional regulator PaaX
MALARSRDTTVSQTIARLVEAGLTEQEHEHERFHSLADRFARSTKTAERRALKKRLARATFGS